MPTPTQRLADILLDGKLREFVLTRRDAGQSWRKIALAIRDETRLDVSPVTIQAWFTDTDEDDLDEAPAAAAG